MPINDEHIPFELNEKLKKAKSLAYLQYFPYSKKVKTIQARKWFNIAILIINHFNVNKNSNLIE